MRLSQEVIEVFLMLNDLHVNCLRVYILLLHGQSEKDSFWGY